MERRNFLRRLGGGGLIGLGGCVGTPTSATESPDSPSEEPQRRISLADQDSVPEETNLKIKAEIHEPTITESHTSQIRVTVTNNGPTRGISVSTGRCALFNRYSQTSDPRGIWLGLADEPVYATQTGPQWIVDPPENGRFPDYGCGPRTYEPDESVHVEYAIFHDNRTNGYLDSGTYRFIKDDILVTPDASGEIDTDGSIVFSWGFSLTIDNPNCTLCL